MKKEDMERIEKEVKDQYFEDKYLMPEEVWCYYKDYIFTTPEGEDVRDYSMRFTLLRPGEGDSNMVRYIRADDVVPPDHGGKETAEDCNKDISAANLAEGCISFLDEGLKEMMESAKESERMIKCYLQARKALEKIVNGESSVDVESEKTKWLRNKYMQDRQKINRKGKAKDSK